MRRSTIGAVPAAPLLLAVAGAPVVAAAGAPASASWKATIDGAGLRGTATVTMLPGGRAASLRIDVSGVPTRTMWTADVDSGTCATADLGFTTSGDLGRGEVVFTRRFAPRTGEAVATATLTGGELSAFDRSVSKPGVRIEIDAQGRHTCAEFVPAA